MSRDSRVVLARLAAAVLFFGLGLGASRAGAEDAAGIPSSEAPGMAIRVEGGRLSATVSHAPAGVVLRRIAEQAGFALALDPSLEAVSLSIEVEGLELEQALRRLIASLEPASFVLEFAQEGDGFRMTSVTILASPGGASGPDETGATRPRTIPDGLQKKLAGKEKGTGHVPPGQEKQSSRGKPLPPGQAKQWGGVGALPGGIREHLEQGESQWVP